MLTFAEYANRKNFEKKLVGQYGKMKVFVVNGDAVRNSSPAAQEFGASSLHCYLPGVIPENEIWIEDDIKPSERKVLVASALYQQAHVDQGMASRKAYKLALAKEKDYRDSVRLSHKKPWRTDRRAPANLYVRKYGHIQDENIDVWLVDGEKVRDKFKTDFIEGGHGYVYPWVPNEEMWIELGPHTNKEAPFIILHEYVERTLMKYKKMSYDKAHDMAAKVEFMMRNRGFDKKAALSLTTQRAAQLIKESKK